MSAMLPGRISPLGPRKGAVFPRCFIATPSIEPESLTAAHECESTIQAAVIVSMLSFIFCSLAAVVLVPVTGRYLFRKRVARDVTTLRSPADSLVRPQHLRPTRG